MTDEIRVEAAWLVERQVSQTVRVPVTDDRWAMGAVVVADRVGYKVKGTMSDEGGNILVSLVRWSAADEDAAREPHC